MNRKVERRPPGRRPPGSRPPGRRPPGSRPPGRRPPGSRPPGPLARWIVALGLVCLGGVAAWRVPLSYLPEQSFPELLVELALPQPGELGEVTRRWIVPLENALRATGGVSSTAGEAHGRGIRLRVRFHRDVDPEAKAARLESELAAYRRRLPPGARLMLEPASQGRSGDSAIVWLEIAGTEDGAEDGARDARSHRLEHRLLALPEVRRVEMGGLAERELVVRPRRAEIPLDRLTAALDRELSSLHLGRVDHGGRRVSVWADERRGRGFGDLVVPSSSEATTGNEPTTLAALATLALETPEPLWRARHQGRPGAIFFIGREDDTSPLAFRRAVLGCFASEGIAPTAMHFLVDEARPMTRLLRRLALGFGSAVALLALLGGWLGGWRLAVSAAALLPVGLAMALQLLWLGGQALDVSTLPALAIALVGALLGWSMPRPARSLPWFVVTVGTVPITLALAGGVLAPVLGAPGRVLLLALVGALPGMLVLPRPAFRRPLPWLGQGVRRLLRSAATVLLLGLTVVYGLLLQGGKALKPTTGEIPMATLDLMVSLRFPEGSTLAQAERRVAAIEHHLEPLSEIETFWSVYGRWGGTLGITLEPEHRQRHRLRPLVRRLESELAGLGVSVTVTPFASGAADSQALRWNESLEDRSVLDPEEAFAYTFVLRSTDLPALRLAHEVVEGSLRQKSASWSHYPDRMRTAWWQPTVQLELAPRPGTSPELARRALDTIVRRSAWPGARPLPGDDDLPLRLVAADGPRSEDDVPRRDQLLALRLAPRNGGGGGGGDGDGGGGGGGEPLAVGEIFTLRERVASPGVRRQGGRFVLPVTLRLRGNLLDLRQQAASSMAHRLTHLELPPGVELELPDLSLYTLRHERLRMVAIAMTFPLLLLAVALCRLDAVGRAIAAMTAPLVGVAVAAPVIWSQRGSTDEGSLFALAAALAITFPVALEAAARGWPRRESPLAGGFAHRWLVAGSAPLGLAVVGGLVLLALPALGQASDREPWSLPLLTAAVAMTGSCLGAWCLVPLLVAGGQRLRRHDPEIRQRLRHPPSWQGPGPLELTTRNLSKVYGDGFRALSGVEMTLRPGIVGLLGPNGAGKTTLLRLVCGLLEPSRGQVLFRGVPVTPDNLPDYRRSVGFLPQEFNAYEGMTAAHFLDYWALERGLKDPRERRHEIGRVLEQVGLSDAAGRKVRQFSGGMRRRIGIARALLGDPPIVVVDEPTTGLDVESRHRLRQTLLSVAGERVILFSTHIASDVAAAAGRILLLHHGRLLFDGPAHALIDRARGRVFETVVSDHELRELSHLYRVSTRVRIRDGIRVRAVTLGDREPAGELVVPNLEEAYLAELGALDEAPSRSTEHDPQEASRRSGRSRVSLLLDVDAWRRS